MSVHGAYPELRLSADSVVAGAVSVEEITAQLQADGTFRIHSRRSELGGASDGHENIGVSGKLLSVRTMPDGFRVESSVKSGPFEAELEFLASGEDYSATLDFSPVALTGFAGSAWLPPEYGWLRSGQVASVLIARLSAADPARLNLHLELTGLGFDSPDGRFAGEQLSLGMEINVSAPDWTAARIEGEIKAGQLLLDDFYRDFSDGGLDFAFRLQSDDETWSVRELLVTDGYSLTVEGAAMLDLSETVEVTGIEVSRLDLSFPGAYTRYVEPAVSRWTLNGLQMTGEVSWSGEWVAGTFQSGDLVVTDLSIVDVQRQRFAMTGLDAHLRPGDYRFDSSLSWQGLLVGKINLGSGQAALDSEPGAIAIVRPLLLDVMGGELELHELRVQLPGGAAGSNAEPDIRLRLDLRNLEMKQITAAFGWPEFAGKISGQIPGVRLQDGVLDVDGQIRVSVFDGDITMDNLRIERPFGVLPSLAANMEVDNLDLELLTSTFSFGSISGRIDGYVKDLRMLEWRPVAFDGWLGTPDRQRESKEISLQAVNRLTTLGGGSATTALTSPLLKFFKNYSYKRLGFGCAMRNNICEVRGVSEDDVSVLIMEGAGVPKLTIRAFNRTVDWPQLLAQLLVAPEGEGIRVGD